MARSLEESFDLAGFIEFRILDDLVAEAVNDHGDGVDAGARRSPEVAPHASDCRRVARSPS